MSPPQELGGRYRMVHLDFCVDAGDLNLGLKACTAGALPTHRTISPAFSPGFLEHWSLEEKPVPIQSDLILPSVILS